VDIRPVGERALLLTFGSEISEVVHGAVLRATRALLGMRGLLNLHPAYTSLLVEFDLRRLSPDAAERAIAERVEQAEREPAIEPCTVEIPVRYGGTDGPDLEDVARHCGLPPGRVIDMHSSASYLVYFLGFSPGFAYLGGMPAGLATPRLATPRTHVPAGSVAIGGAQTGVYPVASPGGWRIIGRTPLRLFRPEAAPPVLLEMGNRVRFVPILEDCP
jgi:5-oxoprolinase (ATP-hydrolysing) subunit B